MTTHSLHVFPEPALTFAYGQAVEHPRDGLTLFGPLDEGQPVGLRVGVIGTRAGIALFRAWARRIRGPLADVGHPAARPAFPGFQAAFGVPWKEDPVITISVDDGELARAVHLDDRHQRVYRTVDVFVTPLLEAVRREEVAPDLWFIVIPDDVYAYCRPRSTVPQTERVRVATPLNPRWARSLRRAPSLFAADNVAAVAYHYEVDFHNQLKARLLPHSTPTQIARESTLAPQRLPGIKRDVSKMQAAVAWSLSTAAFYKAGFRPWKMSGVREGVCYIGLTFKRDLTADDPRSACCAAQMFLDSGDGIVFRGAVGPWYNEETEDYHLTRQAARELVGVAVGEYTRQRRGPPLELFLHGRVWFAEEEWRGFFDAIDSARTNLVGIRIRTEGDLRLFRLGSHPVLRGTAYIRTPRRAYLWTRGFTPRLGTYVGREVPRPLSVDVVRGQIDIETVLSDVLALTKLNYNACILGDGLPVTLRFADAVGEILTAGPVTGNNPLPFKFYI